MTKHRFLKVPAALRTTVVAVAVSMMGAGAAQAATDIEVWFSLNEHNKEVFEGLVKKFNRDQDDVKVKLKAFNSPKEIEPALLQKVGAKEKTPNLVQIDDNRDPESLAGRSYIMPLHTLLAKHPIKDAKWFVAPQNLSMRDAKGRLLAFPYMIDVPVMYYNIDAFKKAGVKPEVPKRSWYELQEQLIDLANKATRNCPATTDQSVSVNLENLAAVNNQFFTSSDNGTKGVPSFAFDTTFVRHLSLMISWVKAELLVNPAADIQALDRFGKSECSILMSESSNLGRYIDTRSLNFGVTGLPYYPQVTKEPGNPFLDGTGLWATSGHNDAEQKATAQFLDWLSRTDNAATWYQKTGFLPLTQQAFDATGPDYYKNLGDWRNLVAVYAKPPVQTARGFKINNYPEIRDMFHRKLHDALAGTYPAVTALTNASSEATQMMRRK
ncbi:extracellular solute-binding protein [Neopusillimonas aromaticivorans]|uniref:extracellular solute-binding protein n=1 Tax=Neopusillimonas aromaticivorans TaxID=2979868 RepID=UPI0025968A55|nr:extracellular solute-binding protein [Neopusillimonas aromaticivorans]NLZ09929.1 extracellular solute-binding protein [Alcaligenaceae bacterium]WJJ93396.1 extracellular solute-binding protein [Neopusillimonas aromaticivorans]